MRDEALSRIANNWVHDFASGLWGACVLVVWLLEGRLAGVPAEAAEALADAQALLVWVLAASLVAVVVTGGVRLAYWRSQTPPDELAVKRRALVGKHLWYLGVYGAGTVWAWTMAAR